MLKCNCNSVNDVMFTNFFFLILACDSL
jgi:hypothetical protein